MSHIIFSDILKSIETLGLGILIVSGFAFAWYVFNMPVPDPKVDNRTGIQIVIICGSIGFAGICLLYILKIWLV